MGDRGGGVDSEEKQSDQHVVWKPQQLLQNVSAPPRTIHYSTAFNSNWLIIDNFAPKTADTYRFMYFGINYWGGRQGGRINEATIEEAF